jgi:hypothetical protein
VGRGRGIKEGFMFCVETTCFASLAHLVSSNKVWGWAIRSWDYLSSFKTLIKNYPKKEYDMPSIMKSKFSKEAIKSSTVPDCFNLVKQPKWCVSVSKCS